MENKLYPGSGVEIRGTAARRYDMVMNIMSFGLYAWFIQDVIKWMGIDPQDKIVDFGAGTGRNACLMRRYLDANGKIDCLEIGEDMRHQLKSQCEKYSNVHIYNQRIDHPLPLEKESYDKILISFVIHGLPQDSRIKVVENAYSLLKKGGSFFVLDFKERKVDEIPFYIRIPFKKIECPYAFDYMENYNWTEIYQQTGFTDFKEKTYLQNLIRIWKITK